jgi:hypothetical protein
MREKYCYLTPSPPSPVTTTMKNPWLLSLVLLLAVSSSLPLTTALWRPLRFPAAGQSPVECVGDGVYAANSTYQANLRRVAALLLTEVSATPGHSYATRAVGYWPNRLMASSLCWRDYRCADCIAGAFLEVERACPYRREALFSNRNCTLELAEIRIFGTGGIFREFFWPSAMLRKFSYTKSLAGFSILTALLIGSFAMPPINLWQPSEWPGIEIWRFVSSHNNSLS